MKKYYIPVIAASLSVFAAQGLAYAEEAEPAAEEAVEEAAVEEEEDGQNPVMNVMGIYSDGTCSAYVVGNGRHEADVFVFMNGKSLERSDWTMTGEFNTETNTIEYADAIREDKVFGDDDVTIETVYENGTGRFRFTDDYKMIWEDDMEGMEAGKEFQFVTMEGNAENIYLTEDQVLAIEAPDFDWSVVADPEHWFTLTNGADRITIDHLRNGEKLPEVQIAGKEFEAVSQTFVSTKNEVFSVLGAAAKQEDLEPIMRAISTVKILKFDTKTAVEEKKEESAYAITKVGATYVVTADPLNVREGFSTESRQIGTLAKGTEVYVIGNVTKDGKDFGWSQIKFGEGDGTAFVSSKFLTPAKAENKEEKKEEKKEEPKKDEEKKEEEPKKEEQQEDEPAEESEDEGQEMTLFGSDDSEMTVFRASNDDKWTDTHGLVYEEVEKLPDLYYEAANKTYWYTAKNWDQIKLYAEDGTEIDAFLFGESSKWLDLKGKAYVRREGNAPVFEAAEDGREWSNFKEYWEEKKAIEEEQAAAEEESYDEPEESTEESSAGEAAEDFEDADLSDGE